MSKSLTTMAILVLLVLGTPLAATGIEERVSSELPDGPLLPWTGEEVVWQGFGADLGMQNDPSMPVYAEYLKTTGNARIEWQTVPWNDYDQKLNLYLQSADLPEIVWARDVSTVIANYSILDIFLDWDRYKNRMPNMRRWIDEFPHLNNILTENNQRFAITDIATADYIGWGWFYNPEILMKAGHSKPPESVEEMIDIMRDIKEGVPGADAFLPIGGHIYWAMGAFGSAMNIKHGIGYDPEAGKWAFSQTMNPDHKQMISYLNEIYEFGGFNADMLAGAGAKIGELFSEGNYGFTYQYYSFIKSHFGQFDREPPLKGMKPPSYKGQSYYWVTAPYDGRANWGYMFPKDVKMPELLAAYIDNIMSIETYYLFEWGIEGETYIIHPDGRPQYLETYDEEGRKDLGVYNFWDPRYIHFSDYENNWFAAECDAGYIAMAADITRLKAGEQKPTWSWPRPLMSVEQNDEIGKIMARVNTFLDEEQVKFITGERPMFEWDEFIAQLSEMGDIEKVLTYYNEGTQYVMGERRYPNTWGIERLGCKALTAEQ